MANREWAASDENNYSHWVETSWTNDVFTNPKSILYNLKTDCADASYAMRAFYAFQNGLPVYFRRHDGNPVNQTMTMFDNIKDSNQRFRAYLNYLFDATSTYTLGRDTYPIAITREQLRAGTVYVSPGIHSYQITGLDQYGIPQTLSSTVPRKERLLFSHYGFPFYIPQDIKNKRDGFRAFITKNNPAVYEQYDIGQQYGDDFLAYQKTMIQKLKLEAEPFEKRITRIKGNLCFFSRERAVLVADAFVKHQEKGGACFGPADFDDYSTYIRDKKLKSYFTEFKKMTTEPGWQNTSLEAKHMLLSAFLEEISSGDCSVETSLPRKPIISLSEIFSALESGRIVSDPNATMAQRWGLEPYAPQCPLY